MRSSYVPWAVGALVALPYLLVRSPPMGDLAFHEASVSLLRHLGDPGFAPPGLYRANLGQPNQLFPLLAYALSFLVPTHVACNLVVAAVAMSLPVSTGRLAKHLSVSPWASLVVAPLSLGWMSRWGLVANLLGVSLLLASLPSADRAAAAPGPRRALAVSGLAVLLFFAHESALALFAVAIVVFAARTPRRAVPLFLSLAPLVVVAVLAVTYHLRSESLKAPSVLAAVPIVVPFFVRLIDIPGSLFAIGRASPYLFFASVASLALCGPTAKRTIPWRYVVLGGFALLVYFVLPEALGGSTLLFQRVLPVAFAVLFLAFAPPETSTGAPVVAAVLPLAMLFATHHLFVQADVSARALDVVLGKMEDGQAVAQLDLDPRNPSPVAPIVGEAARALATHGGRLLFSFTDAPTFLVTMPAARRWDEPVKRMAMTPFAFAPSYDLLRFRYVLVKVTKPRLRKVLARAFAPEAKLVAEAGDWMLYESTLPVARIDADDAVFPTPAPEPLAARVKALLGSPSSGPGEESREPDAHPGPP